MAKTITMGSIVKLAGQKYIVCGEASTNKVYPYTRRGELCEPVNKEGNRYLLLSVDRFYLRWNDVPSKIRLDRYAIPTEMPADKDVASDKSSYTIQMRLFQFSMDEIKVMASSMGKDLEEILKDYFSGGWIRNVISETKGVFPCRVAEYSDVMLGDAFIERDLLTRVGMWVEEAALR